jgi:hypothetical protein
MLLFNMCPMVTLMVLHMNLIQGFARNRNGHTVEFCHKNMVILVSISNTFLILHLPVNL